MNETLDNDSTKKQLGFEYQKLIALEFCLNARRGEYVYIECFGDVQYGSESIEIKHHEGKSNLTSNSKDVWKTLKNLAVEYDKLKSNDRFILHTTQNIANNSIFYNWNDLNKVEKYNKLFEHSISATSKPYKDDVFNTKIISKTDLLDILERFVIYSDEPKIVEKLNQLKEHPTFKIIKDDLKEAAIGVLIQYMVRKAIDNSDRWEINISDFNSDLQFSLTKFANDYIPFPIVDKKNINVEDLNKGYRFIENLTAISLKESDIHQAFQDYVRSEEAYEQILIINPTLKMNLISYEDEIKTSLHTEKSSASYDLTNSSFEDNSHIRTSQKVYFKCIMNPINEISGFKGTQKFFRDGRIHNINETTDFEWLYKRTEI